MAGVQESLLELHRCLQPGDAGAAMHGYSLLRSLGETCLTSPAGGAQGAPWGPVRLPRVAFRDCREEALKFLCVFMEKVGDEVHPYACNIKLLRSLQRSCLMEEMKVGEIFNKFYGELATKSKIPDTVLEKIYELLGVLGQVQPSDMINNSEKLFRAYLGELKTQMTSATRAPKLPVVAGCLRGLAALMYNFTKSVDEDPQTAKEIFDFAMRAINPQVDQKRYAVHLAGLQLFIWHAAQFGALLLDNYVSLFEAMWKWCGHTNQELKKTSNSALDSFLKQISLMIAQDAERHKNKLQFFMEQFYAIIRRMDSSNKELSIAIRGYGLFAAPCKAIHSKDVDDMYVELLQRCKQMYLTEAETIDDHLYQLPSFLQSIASVILHIDTDFFGKGTSGSEDSREAAEVETGRWKVPTYKDYLYLFRSLLNCDTMKECVFEDENFLTANTPLQSLNRLLYDELLKSILKIIEKLDLTVQRLDVNEQDENETDGALVGPTSDPASNLQPTKPTDFIAFINLVEFCREILPEKHVEYFNPWVYSFGYKLIIHSTRLPLISGFYKLLSVTMKIAKKIKYFEGVSPQSVRKCPEDPEKRSCFALFAKFGKEVTAKMKQYKDELLASCLNFLLSLPHEIIMLDIKAYIPALQNAFKLGLSCTPMANLGLDALEDWSAHIPRHIMQPYYKDVLPLLDGYLKNSASTAASAEEMMKKCVSWDTEKRLSFAVPFADMKPVIYLDLFLPRVTELALSASDRQTKVTRQLYEPLVMQLIHWFTNNKKFESQDTVVFLEAILSGIVDPVDSTLRDFCGQCVREFLKWSIKQTTPRQQERSPVNTKSLFKRLYSLALHPSAFKRLGAALAFNSIYREFREENSLVEQFVFEALVVFLESLALTHTDEKSLATKSVCLQDVVMWLLVQCGRPQTECRHKSMELFYEFVPLLPGNKSPSSWLADVLKEQDVSFLINKFEGGGSDAKNPSGILSQPTLHGMQEPFSLQTVMRWMDMFLAALDCYNTFSELRMIKPHEILCVDERSSFLEAVQFFLETIALHDIHAAEKYFDCSSKGSTFSPQERDVYNYSKCTIIVRIMEFVTMILETCQQDFWKLLEKELLNANLIELLVMTVCDPSHVGFNIADVQVMKNLPDISVRLMKALMKSPYKESLKLCIKKRITPQSLEDLCSVDLFNSDARFDQVRLSAVLSACKQLQKSGLLHSVLHNQDGGHHFSVGSKLLSVVYKSIAPGDEGIALPSLDISSKQLADRLLQLAFAIDDQCEELVSLLLNTVVLSVPLSGASQKNLINFSHGQYFYSLFSETINQQLLKNLDVIIVQLMESSVSNPQMVSSILNGMLDQSFRERTVRKQQGAKLVTAVLRNWRKLDSWWAKGSSPKSKMAILTLLAKVLQIDSSVSFNTNHEAFTAVFNTYTSLLTDQDLGLNLKGQAVIILPFFTNLTGEKLNDLKNALDQLVAFNFPMRSDEFTKGTLRHNNYVDCTKKFLDALELSQSPMLLQLMTEVLCRDRRHCVEDLFQASFKRISRRSTTDKQVILLDTVHKMFQREELLSNKTRQAFVDRSLLTLLWHCSLDALREFFGKIIVQAMDTLNSRFTKSNECIFYTQVTKKMGYYKLLEVMYVRLSKEDVYSKDSKINQAYRGSMSVEGNELTKTLIKSCYDAFTENMAGECLLLEERRQYHCAAYNCAIAVISCVFTESKFYQGFLFTEKPEKNLLIFENLIDLKHQYMFPVEIEVPLEKKKRYIAIRKEARDAGNSDQDEPKYLASASYMMDSSLSEEMSQFDFSTGVQGFSYSSQDVTATSTRFRRKEPTEYMVLNDEMELEMDELNQHECMASLTTLIKHMQRNQITPKVEEASINPKGTLPVDLPLWMKFLHGKLGNPSVPLNIRLFIAKLIVNTEDVFRPYAKQWLGPLLQLVVSGNNGGEGIHYMVVEIVVTILSWTSVATPKGSIKDEILANRLLEFLMKNAFHQERAVFRHNLEIIKTVIECWKNCLSIPYSLIFEKFSSGDPDTKDNSVGIQLLGIVLANNLPPFDPKCEIDRVRYFQALASNMGLLKYKEVYAAAAEVLGLALHYLAEREDVLEDPVYDCVIRQLKQHQNTQQDKFIQCLNKVVKNFPPLADRFMNAVFFLIPKLHGVMKTYCLEVIMCRAEEIPDLHLQLKTKDFTQIMNHRDDERQRVCLDIVYKMLSKLKPLELKELLPAVSGFISHPSVICRQRMYDILMWIYDNYSDPESQADGDSQEILKLAKEILLQGLIDENAELQLIVRNFWSYETRLPANIPDRMLALLNSLYSTKIETQYLSLITNFLLEMTSKSPDYSRKIFEHPLSECKFQDFVIDSSWRYRSTILTPMFVETQASQSIHRNLSQERSLSASGSVGGRVRATQRQYEFTPTQHVSIEERAEILRLRRRFLKDKEKLSLIYARKGVAEQKREQIQLFLSNMIIFFNMVNAFQEMKSELKMKCDAQVTLYRRYRVGDLPDIQIEYRSLIAPLQGLAQKDPTFAKQLFSSLFGGIFHEVEKSKSPSEKTCIVQKLLNYFNNFLSMSQSYFPPFIACIQEMSYQHRELLELDSANVSTSCLASLQQPVGILLLERALMALSPAQEPPSKRMRGKTELPPDVIRWIELAKLYRSLGDYDVLHGIFSGKIGTKEITQKALLAEARSDYAEAAKYYDEETYLPYIIRSKLKLLLNGENDQTLLTFIDEAMKTEQKKAIIEMHYSQELSLLYILQDDFDRAKYYISNGMQIFMQSYSSIDSLLYQSRMTKLQSVQALTEIQDFINFMTKRSNLASQASLKRLLRIWTSRYPDVKMDPMNIWDDIITNRRVFISSSAILSENSVLIWIQNSFSVAKKLLKDVRKDTKTREDWLVRWNHAYCRFVHSCSWNQSCPERLLSVLKTISLLEDTKSDYVSKNIMASRNQNLLLGTTYHIMANALSQDPRCLKEIGEEKAGKISVVSGESLESPEKVLAGLNKKAFQSFSSAARKSEEEVQSRSMEHVDVMGVIDAYMTLVGFCDQHLRREEEGLLEISTADLQLFPAIVVEKMIKALKLNSREARLRFPRLLQIIERYPAETLGLVTRELSSVPCWQFIGWISQMMALLDKDEAVAVQHTVEEIANTYPQAIIYPFMISSESYCFKDTAAGCKNKEFVERIRNKLDKGGVVQDFIHSLEQLSNPIMLFKAFGKDFDHHFGRGGSELLDMNASDFDAIATSLLSKMNKTHKEPRNLKEYSPWMSEFRAEFLRNELEVPGQYDGKGKPLPEYHAKISGFDERISVMESLRKPKRITIRGSDEQEYPFLVKGGEDLRQDQRIEQLFDVMNIILSQDAMCSQRNMQLKTYQVIPVTTRLGLIKWLENTCTLKEFLKNSMSEEEDMNYNRNASRTETVMSFKSRESSVPEDLLRRAFVKMSTSPEAFLSLRSHFASSHALMSISHWILGIGDRHLSNFMINKETGGMVGIDFGYAFGSATQFLGVPELMPFRLTRQFVNLMMPVKEWGLVYSVMVHALRAYRRDPDLLISTMDVFVKEPSLDWKNFEQRQLKKGGTWIKEINTSEVNWYPLQRVSYVKRKLTGANPAAVTCDELRLGHEKLLSYNDFAAVARGNPDHNIRAKEPEDGLSEETQVRCLIDQATDPNILGRVWEGWEPWM
ncbi:Prkdc [Columba guinea]|nr:Prkdc [Columba guinea]